MGKSKVLVVDDEPQITRVLRTTLSSRGYEMKTAEDGEKALECFHDWQPDLLITDLSMPKMNGIELCRAVREQSQIPIIVLSVRGEDKVKVEAFENGADDYVTKPFSTVELLARISANLRRASWAKEAPGQPITIGDFYLDAESRIVKVKDKEVHLTPKEFEVLTFMLQHPGRALPHRKLLAAVWGGQNVHQPEYLRVFVNQLRKKIEPSDTPRYILTDPWIGYRFEPEGK